MRSKIYFPEQASETFEEVFASFIISQTSRGVSATTIRNYHSRLKGISKHLDTTMPFCALSKRHLESMVVSMPGVVLPRCATFKTGMRIWKTVNGTLYITIFINRRAECLCFFAKGGRLLFMYGCSFFCQKMTGFQQKMESKRA